MFVDRRRFTLVALASACGVRSASGSTAPAGELDIVVPYPPGGGAFSVSARLLADAVSATSGRSVMLDHRPGASGTIGMSHVAAARPDGATLGMGSVSTLAVLPAVRSPMVHYDPLKSFTHVASIADAPMLLAVSTELPVATFARLVATARDRPGELNYVSMGDSGISDIAMQLIQLRTGMKLVKIPYQSASAVLADVGGGRVHLMLDQPAALKPLLSSHIVRPLVVMSTARMASHPDVPAAGEVGLGGLESTVWSGIVAPAALPRRLLDEIDGLVQAALRSTDVVAGLQSIGFTARPGSPDRFADFVQAELQRWTSRVLQLQSHSNGATPDAAHQRAMRG